jgi:glycosyltransferase involved in cell wall biosynthesis
VKVAHIESGRHLYGGARQVAALIEGLAERGVDNVLLCPPGSALAAATLPAQRITVPMAGELDLGLAGRLETILRRVRPDLVHVHSRRGADLYGGLAARRARIPAIVTRRVESAEPAAWLCFRYRPYRAVIAISGAIEQALERAGIARERLHRVASGVDTNLFLPDPSARSRLCGELGLSADALVIGVAAQLIARKGHAWLFDCLPELVRREPRLVVCCFGRGAREHALRRRAAALGIHNHVRFAGFRADLHQVLPGLDVLVHPALREGLGLALLEAMSAGVPVVAAEVGGVVDVIRDRVDGLLVPAADRGRLTDALAQVIADEALRVRLGVAARERVLHGFSVAQMTAGNLRVYDALLGERA